MFCARWFNLTLVVLSTTVLAQETPAGDNCDWFCWIDQRIDALEQQVAKLTNLLFPDQNGNVPSPPSDDQPSSTQTPFPSSFGTPYVSTTRPYNDAATASQVIVSEAIVTVSSTGTDSRTTTNTRLTAAPDVESRHGYRTIGYFGNWDIYARKYYPQQITASKLTHLLYGFADIHENGTIFLTDSYADTEIHYSGDWWSDSGHNVYGAVKQLHLLKAKNRNLKVLLSIGGWTYTNEKKHMDAPASTEEGRKRFAASCVDMVRDNGFDGIDVDWEYPQDSQQGAQFLALLREVRTQLDAYAATLGNAYDGARPHFLISIAAPAGEANYRNMPLREISGVLDFVNLMAYDYSGSWDKTANHASNLHLSLANPQSTPYNTDAVLAAYLAAGVPAAKLNLGMPLYGRAFTSTAGLGKPYNGIGKGSWEAGVYDFKDLPLEGTAVYYDNVAGATFSYDNETGMLISYDTVNMALRKVDYIKQKQLGGAMWWEVSGDRQDDGSIIKNVVNRLGGADGSGIESSSNWLFYPDSQYDNIKDGFAK